MNSLITDCETFVHFYQDHSSCLLMGQ